MGKGNKTKADLLKLIQELETHLIEMELKNEEMILAKDNDFKRLKSAFIYNISHEVRTPLNGILGFSGLLMQHNITLEEKKKFYSCIKTCSDQLLSIITKYIDISLIASGNMEMKRKTFNPYLILTMLMEQFQPICAELHLDLYLKTPGKAENITLCSDDGLLIKVLSHLLNNAVKFTQKGKITFGYKLKSGLLEFFVKDTGTGINKEAKSRIFENFHQEEESILRGKNGSGLGLSIASGLLRLLGAEIVVESEKGAGSTFTFALPYDEMSII
jgi:signal transduction histidine kinase